ncbi:MAG: aminoacyl-tRNA hydrolase [Chloroflexi bacterium]|nr:aminoacyl-tRNA hydrolase [Chloroflexota bacterium]
MKLIVGLGNLGMQYANTRHNAGFMALEYLAKENKLEFNKSESQAKIAKGTIAGYEILLAKPQTFMNLSGLAVKKLMNKYRLSIDDIVVIHDDLDLPIGKMRIKKGGGTGGHNGLESIVDELDNASFARIRLGISRPEYSDQMASYVLNILKPEERKSLEELLPTMQQALIEILRFDVNTAANKYNGEKQEKKIKEQEITVFRDQNGAFYYKVKKADGQEQAYGQFSTLKECQAAIYEMAKETSEKNKE